MKLYAPFFFIAIVILAFPARAQDKNVPCRRLPVSVYRDKLEGAWAGQIAGVCWGAPTEFRYNDKIIPETDVPKWSPEMINNAFGQDDLYVEMTFLRTLDEYGLDVSIRQAGIDFANSEYELWCANDAGRKNLRRGIAPPDSSHPQFSTRGNDIDYQIEADFSGIIAPGMPNVAIKLGEKFGRLMNYGDGVYAGQFIGGMYAEAYFENDVEKIVEAGLRCIPAESRYAEMVRDMLAWYRANPNDWEETWKLCQKKYREDPEYQKASNGGIDAKINGAYVLMGLLYGQRDFEKTIVISMRCGQDSDCNPSSAAGVLGETFGFNQLPWSIIQIIDNENKFHYTTYNLPGVKAVCEKLTREILIQEGGWVETDAEGNEVFVIPIKEPIPSKLERTDAPGPIAGSVFTDQERAKIKQWEFSLDEGLAKFLPGWTMTDCGPDMSPGWRKAFRGRADVIMTHPKDQKTPCVLSRVIDVPETGKTTLKAIVAHHEEGKILGDWTLRIGVKDASGAMLAEKDFPIEKASAGTDGWTKIEFDLTPWRGKSVTVNLENRADGWEWEAGYWGAVNVVTE